MKKSILILLVSICTISSMVNAQPVGNPVSQLPLYNGNTNGAFTLVSVPAGSVYNSRKYPLDSLVTKKYLWDNAGMISTQWFNVQKNGGDNTGMTDVSNLVNNAIKDGVTDIYFPKGIYYLQNSIMLKNNVTILGDGRGATVLKVLANIPAIKGTHYYGGYQSQITNLCIEGNKDVGGGMGQMGIRLDTVAKVLVSNVFIRNIGGYGIRMFGQGYCCASYTQNGTRGNNIDDSYFELNYCGVLFDTTGEFNKVRGSTFHGNNIALRIAGGSCEATSNNINYNTYGIYLTGGSNNGHGLITSNEVAHNQYSLYISGVTNGMSLTGNNIHSEDSIVVRNSSYVNILGGWFFSGTVIYYDNTTNCTITGNNTLNTNEPTITVGSGEIPTYIKAGKVDNGLSFIDSKNSRDFVITHVNGIVNFSGMDSLKLVPIPRSSNTADSMLVINTHSGALGKRAIPSGGGGTPNYWTSSGGNIFNNTGTFVGIGTNTPTELLTLGNGNLLIRGGGPGGIPGKIDWGTTYGGDALVLYNGGPLDRYGWGLQPSNMQFHIPSSGGQFFSFNGGGDLQSVGTNEKMRIMASSGQVGIGTTSIASSALLDISSTSKGLLIPRLTSSQIAAISTPDLGLMTINTNDSAISMFNGVIHGRVRMGGVNLFSTNTTLTKAYNIWVFTGTSAVMVVPDPNTCSSYEWTIVNKGSGMISMMASANHFWAAGVTSNSLIIPAGESRTIFSDGINLNVK